jgi:hypothetical protein
LKLYYAALLALLPLSAPAYAGVTVKSPTNNSTIPGNARYIATSAPSTRCASGVGATGIYVDDALVYTAYSAAIDTPISLSAGYHHTVVQEWDNCGGSSIADVNVFVQSSGNTLKSIQANQRWKMSGQVAPYYSDCDFSCPGVNFSRNYPVSGPSLGNAAQFNLGGTTPYADVLFYNQLIGTASTYNLPDFAHTLVPTLHGFSYDADFYLENASSHQAVEFDVNSFPGGGAGLTWGTECRVAGGQMWDVWDNANGKWISTGVACNPYNNAWNHVTVNVQRGADNSVIYQSIVMNGQVINLNKTFPPFTVPGDWYGITVNYQMDGNYRQDSIRSYVDNLNFRYW